MLSCNCTFLYNGILCLCSYLFLSPHYSSNTACISMSLCIHVRARAAVLGQASIFISCFPFFFLPFAIVCVCPLSRGRLCA
ncbi:unnamed protein product, partial [Discosporangium mesarthrocarpum]